jgi:hypothetical protein
MESNIITTELQKQLEGLRATEQVEQLFQSWAQFQEKLEIDLERTAQESKAIQRKREISSAKDLLRLILF